MSYLNNILDAVVTKVSAIGFTMNGLAVPVVKGKIPKLHPKTDNTSPTSQIYVCSSDKLPRESNICFGKIRIDSMIEISLVSPNGGSNNINLDKHAEWQESLLPAFSRPENLQSLVPVVFDVRWISTNFLNRTKLPPNFDYTQKVLRVSTTQASS